MTTLRISEINRPPEKHADGLIRTSDGFTIRAASFQTDADVCKGTVLLLQGRNESIEKYFETVADFGRMGFDVATFDWRGQGGSQRFFARTDAGYVDSYDQYAADLEAVFQQVVLPDCRAPYFVMAHSMGGLIALYTAPRMTNRIRRMVLCAPFLSLYGTPLQNAAINTAAKSMAFLGLGNRYLGGGPAERMRRPFETNRLTTDPRRYSRNISIGIRFPDLALGAPSASWLSASYDAIETVTDPAHMARTTIPILVFMAGDDHVVSNPALLSLVKNLRSASLLTIDGARHELMQETDENREQLFAAFSAFVPGSGE